MNEEINKDYDKAIGFWDSAFDVDEEVKKQYQEALRPDTDDWKNLASSPKLLNIITDNLKSKKNVLDYGCGEGWAGLCIKKSGCANVKCVDVVEHAISFTKYLQSLLKITEGFDAECVSTSWLNTVKEGCYDGIITSNVLDVMPPEVAESILSQLSRIAAEDATVIIGLNYYMEPKPIPEKNVEIKEGNHIYLNGVLRLVSRTDEEWKEVLSKYFRVVSLDYFAWEGETEEKRRVFVLAKK